MNLTVTATSKAAGAYVVAPCGDINSKTVQVLQDTLDQLLTDEASLIVLDMAEANYLDSAGIRVILQTKKTLEARKGRLVFMNLQPQIQRVFDIINALPNIDVFVNLDEMDDFVDRMQRQAGGETADGE